MRKVAPLSRLASVSMGGMHTNLPVPSTVKVDKMVIMMGPYGFYLVGPEPTIVESQTH